MKKNIKHIWFDFSETLAFLKKERHDQLRYKNYAQVVNRPITEELKVEYEALYKKFNNSNAALFSSLGLSSKRWSEIINSVPPEELYILAAEKIPSILQEVKLHVPISIFSNIQLKSVLPALGIDPSWFTHTISAGMVEHPKPALDGFYKMIDLSGIPAENILYIGDHVGKDVLPAKQVGIQAGIVWSSSDEADYSFEKFEDILRLFDSSAETLHA